GGLRAPVRGHGRPEENSRDHPGRFGRRRLDHVRRPRLDQAVVFAISSVREYISRFPGRVVMYRSFMTAMGDTSIGGSRRDFPSTSWNLVRGVGKAHREHLARLIYLYLKT